MLIKIKLQLKKYIYIYKQIYKHRTNKQKPTAQPKPTQKLFYGGCVKHNHSIILYAVLDA